MNENENAGADAPSHEGKTDIPVAKPETEAARGVLERILSGVAALYSQICTVPYTG